MQEETFENLWTDDPPTDEVLGMMKKIGKPFLPERYKDLGKEIYKVIELPDNVKRVVVNKHDAQALHELASDTWNEVYDPERVDEIVSKLKGGDLTEDERKELVDELMDIRDVGQFYRSAWLLFDRSHKAPEELHNLIVSMGELKDFPGEEAEYATELKKKVKKYNKVKDELDDDFNACKGKGFRKFMLGKGYEIQGILEDEDASAVTKQHLLRKEGTRLYMNLFKLVLMRNNNLSPDEIKKIREAYYFFQRIDKKLGKKHDKVVKKQREGKDASMEIPENINIRLKTGVRGLNTQWEEDVKKKEKKSDKKKDKKKEVGKKKKKKKKKK